MYGFLAVFVGAGLGGAARHEVSVAAQRWLGSGYPHGTMIVNILGSFAMGLLVGWFTHRSDPGQVWRLFLSTGVLGGFTTFSTFSLEAALMWERGQAGAAAGYAFASVVLAVLGLFAGLLLIRHFS